MAICKFDCEKSVTKSMQGKIYNLEKAVSFQMIPNVCVSVTCDENCYNRSRCTWADVWPWSPVGLRYAESQTTRCWLLRVKWIYNRCLIRETD